MSKKLVRFIKSKCNFSSWTNYIYDDNDEPESWEIEIEKKLKQSDQGFDNLSEEEKKEKIHALGDENKLISVHLKLDEHFNRHFIEELKLELEKTNKYGVCNEEEARRMIGGILDYRRRAKKIDVKIFFTRLQQYDSNNPIVARVGMSFKYGPVHAGLIIAGVHMHWNADDLVCFDQDSRELLSYVTVYLNRMKYDDSILKKTITESTASTTDDAQKWLERLVSMHFDAKIDAFNKLNVCTADAFEKIAKVCVWYNRNYDYNLGSRNCQTFMDDVLETLGIKFEPQDEFKLFMDRIRTSHPDAALFKYKDSIFRSRQEFDSYVDQTWDSEESNWNKRLLINYSDLMNLMYLQSKKQDANWGPRNAGVWQERLESAI
ncbi:unnamed protein product [Adineta steineri]|uniref:PPPDE domain-containing protein n=1 Tax=Adineta steineri TaxID=433720 RepID=A0A815U5U5_9BILA|nr:unnamed protein product [Adineta steineri]CAF3850770.1 unnamed protein product [Adineta steineri]